MAIQTEIQRISGAKADLKVSIQSKGVTVPSDALINSYDECVDEIVQAEPRMVEGEVISSSATYSGTFEAKNRVVAVNIPEGFTAVGQGAFSGYSYLSSVTLPSTLTEIMGNCFYNCYRLTQITLPNACTALGVGAFFGCSRLTNIDLGGVQTIGSSAFQGCNALQEITLPSTVTDITGASFYSCGSLTTMICEATTPPTMNGNIFNTATPIAHIYVPSASVDTYKAASGWSNYASIIEAIPTAE